MYVSRRKLSGTWDRRRSRQPPQSSSHAYHIRSMGWPLKYESGQPCVQNVVASLRKGTQSVLQLMSALILAFFSFSTIRDRSVSSLSSLEIQVTGSIWCAPQYLSIEIAESEPGDEKAQHTPRRSRIPTATNTNRNQHQPPPQRGQERGAHHLPHQHAPKVPTPEPLHPTPRPPSSFPYPCRPRRHRAAARRARRLQILSVHCTAQMQEG